MFITLEGVDGSGKSTAQKRLKSYLDSRIGPERVIMTREPGFGVLGAKLREILLQTSDLSPTSELFLFLADRSNHVQQLIRPALEAGHWVVSDRFADSTVVYQGHARGLDCEIIRTCNALATMDLVPDLTLLLDVDPELSLPRLTALDRFDRENLGFHKKIREGFLKEASLYGDRFRIIDASLSEEEVWNRIREAIDNLMESQRSV